MTPVPQRNIDTFGGGSIPKNPDPVADFKERLKEKVNKAIPQIEKEEAMFPAGTHGLGVRTGRLNALKWVLKLIDETP